MPVPTMVPHVTTTGAGRESKRSSLQDGFHVAWLVALGVVLGYNLAVQHGWFRLAISVFMLALIGVQVVVMRRYFRV